MGKSTLFNLLTGLNQHVGNWPGKTVERREGDFSLEGQACHLVDLPGTYSLTANSPEEVIARGSSCASSPTWWWRWLPLNPAAPWRRSGRTRRWRRKDRQMLTEKSWREGVRATCPSCNAPLATNAKFCPECGAKIQGGWQVLQGMRRQARTGSKVLWRVRNQNSVSSLAWRGRFTNSFTNQ